jgi:tRNA dimethylallyltransferase
MIQIIVISGPTASGKTALAAHLCEKLQTEIISADSRQVYKYLDIGTNKDLSISQHLINIIEPDKKYSAAEFALEAGKIIKGVNKRGKTAIVSGGTGLYIKALLYGLDDMPPSDEKLRSELARFSAGELYEKLYKTDPQAAQKNKSNPQRLLRSLEINILTGRPQSAHYTPKKPKYNFKHFTLAPERKTLYERINTRCAQMIKNGMIEETKKVLSMGYAKNCYGLSGIGYRHAVEYIDGEITKAVMLEKFMQDTRNYAKRQITWFSHQPDIIQTESSLENLINIIKLHNE